MSEGYDGKATCPACGRRVRCSVPLPPSYRRVVEVHYAKKGRGKPACMGTRLVCREDEPAVVTVTDDDGAAD